MHTPAVFAFYQTNPLFICDYQDELLVLDCRDFRVSGRKEAVGSVQLERVELTEG